MYISIAVAVSNITHVYRHSFPWRQGTVREGPVQEMRVYKDKPPSDTLADPTWVYP